jgi:hypothetical protein
MQLLRRLLLLCCAPGIAASSAYGDRRSLPPRSCSGQGSPDWRNVCNGRLISHVGGYQDQPQVVVRKDGGWSCVFTLGAEHEGGGSQRVVSTVSTDEGVSWTPVTDVEPYVAPAGMLPRSSGWINNLRVPSTGRQYAFYTWNCHNTTTDPVTGIDLPNSNLIGCWVFRTSEDGGLNWSSSRHNISGAYRTTAIDRSNAWGGKILEGWSIGKPLIADDRATVYMQFSKVSSSAGSSEAFFLRSTNVLQVSDPAQAQFELVPRGDRGMQAPSGPVAQEGNLVQLSSGNFYAVFRTENQFMGVATSSDGITWRDQQFCYYATADYGDAMYQPKVKQPTGPTTPRRFTNGLFLMTVFADSQVFPDLHGFTRRDPYWLVAGWEEPGNYELGIPPHVVWSQPEIMLYALPPCEDGRCGIGYPDFIETEAGKIFITETDKKDSRVHLLPPKMLSLMWAQRTHAEVAQRGLVFDSDNSSATSTIPAPAFGNLSAGRGFVVELVLDTADLPHTTMHEFSLFDCRRCLTCSGVSVGFTRGTPSMAGTQNGTVLTLGIRDAHHRGQEWSTDAEARLWLPMKHHVTFVVDGFARVISTFVNGVCHVFPCVAVLLCTLVLCASVVPRDLKVPSAINADFWRWWPHALARLDTPGQQAEHCRRRRHRSRGWSASMQASSLCEDAAFVRSLLTHVRSDR